MRNPILVVLVMTAGAIGTAVAADGQTTLPTTTQMTTAPADGGWNRTGRSRRSDRPDAAAVTPPTTSSTGEIAAGPAKPVPPNYDLLMRRNIFVRGEQAWGSSDATPVRDRERPTQPPPESQQIFTGILLDDDSAVALIEDSDSHQVTSVKPGESFNGGTITNVSIEELTYTVNGRPTRVRVGQDMKGGAVTTALSSPTTSPSAGGSSGKSTDEILERLRKRREEAMGGPKKP